MATYRRRPDGYTERWHAMEGVWRECPADEPETRVRGEREGLFIVPAEYAPGDGPAVIPIDVLIAALESGE